MKTPTVVEACRQVDRNVMTLMNVFGGIRVYVTPDCVQSKLGSLPVQAVCGLLFLAMALVSCGRMGGSISLPNCYYIERANTVTYGLVKYEKADNLYRVVVGPTITEYAVVDKIVVGVCRMQKEDPFAERSHSDYGYFLLDTASERLRKGLTQEQCMSLLSIEYNVHSIPTMVVLVTDK